MKKIYTLIIALAIMSTPAFAYGRLDNNTIEYLEDSPATPFIIQENLPQSEVVEAVDVVEVKEEAKEVNLNYSYKETQFGEAQAETPTVITRVVTPYTQVPKWEDYVPEKYANPRTDFSKKATVTEMTGGIILTCGLLSAPIGIPMIIHSASKMKHIDYAERKATFEKGIKHAETIKDPTARRVYYKKLLKKCELSEADKIKFTEERNK